MKAQGYRNLEDILDKIKDLKLKLGIIKKEDLQIDKISYINVPDEQLNSNQLRQKKIQLFHFQSQQTRKYKKQQQETKRLELLQQKIENPEQYLNSLYEKREKVLKKITKKKQMKQELGVRNSRANMKRMQKFAQLGGLMKQKKNDEKDEFGLNDDDWNMYRELNPDDISEDENDELNLNEIELELRELDQDFEIKTNQKIQLPYYLQTFDYKIILSTELIRCNEIFFHPQIIGVDQGGLTETILNVLNQYDLQTQQKLIDNIMLIGPGSKINNMKERVYQELRSNLNQNSNLNVNIEKGNENSTWKGMQLFSQQQNVNQFYINKQEYEEFGSDFFKAHQLSNQILY